MLGPPSYKLDKLMKDYEAKKFAQPATTYTKNAFDAANIIIEALRKAGPKDKAAGAKAIRATQPRWRHGRDELRRERPDEAPDPARAA
jgi:ABC-type branched-subunit amino acid transport system substrate-binding protein